MFPFFGCKRQGFLIGLNQQATSRESPRTRRLDIAKLLGLATAASQELVTLYGMNLRVVIGAGAT